MPSSPNILLVDDEYLILRDLTHLLRSAGYPVTGQATTVEAAEEVVTAHHPPDLVLCDVYFRGRPTGIDFCRTLAGRNIPYFLISGNAPDRILPELRELRPRGIIYKPFDARDILTRIALFGQVVTTPPPLVVTQSGRKHRIEQSAIHFVRSDGNYCIIHTGDHRYAVLGALQRFLARLGPRFVQCHRAYVVNLDYCSSYTARILVLADGREVPISRSYRSGLLRLLQQ